MCAALVHWFARLLVALSLSAAALGLTAAVPILAAHAPLLLSLAAVTTSAWLCGAVPAIVSGMLAGAVVGVLWLPFGGAAEHLAIVVIFCSLVVIISIQVSGRRNALEALRRRTTQYQTLVDLSPDAIFVAKAGVVTFANRAAAHLLGAKHSNELVSRRALEFVAPEWRDEAARLLAAVPDDASSARVDAAMTRLDGTRIDVAVAAACIDGDDPPSVLMVVRNVSDQKLAEAQLAESNDLLTTLIDASPIAIVGSDLEDTVHIWNHAAEEFFGWTREEVLGGPLPFIPPALEANYRAKIQRILQGEVLRAVETQRLRKDGSIVDVSLWTTALRSTRGEVTLVALIADISERKRLEAQFLQAQKMEAVGRLAGGVAHDFNNLLTAILGYSDLILDHGVDEETRHDLEEIRRAGQSAAGLTKQLLAFSRRQILQPSVFDLRGHIAERQKMLKRLLGEDIDVRVDLGSSPVLVHADPGQLEQVVMNLAVNARDAMPDGGTLTISATTTDLAQEHRTRDAIAPAGRYAVLSVTDTGHGMTAEVQRRLFEPFFTTKDRGKGTGLGLATVYGIVKQTGGYLEVTSQPGAGATFTIYLPLSAELPVTLAASESAENAPRGTETILLVEDDDVLRELARKTLERQGYTVLCAPAAADALTVAQGCDREIHLLLTDVVMPGMNGRALADRLRQVRPSVKVLYMSGYTDNAIVHHGVLDTGAAFLQKPFVPRELALRVREVLAADSRHAPSLRGLPPR